MLDARVPVEAVRSPEEEPAELARVEVPHGRAVHVPVHGVLDGAAHDGEAAVADEAGGVAVQATLAQHHLCQEGEEGLLGAGALGGRRGGGRQDKVAAPGSHGEMEEVLHHVLEAPVTKNKAL